MNQKKHMTYEEFLDEVTTLMTEKYDMSDDDAVKHVMRAQANDFFTLHDDDPTMCTQERAEQDAQAIFHLKNKSRTHTAPKKRAAPPPAAAATPGAAKPARKVSGTNKAIRTQAKDGSKDGNKGGSKKGEPGNE